MSVESKPKQYASSICRTVLNNILAPCLIDLVVEYMDTEFKHDPVVLSKTPAIISMSIIQMLKYDTRNTNLIDMHIHICRLLYNKFKNKIQQIIRLNDIYYTVLAVDILHVVKCDYINGCPVFGDDCIIHILRCCRLNNTAIMLKDGRILISSDINAMIWHISTVNGKITLTNPIGLICGDKLVWRTAQLPNGNILTCSDDNYLRIWDLEGKCIMELNNSSPIWDYAILRDGRFVTCGDNNVLNLWSDNGKHICTYTSMSASSILRVVELDNKIATFSDNRVVNVWTTDMHNINESKFADPLFSIQYGTLQKCIKKLDNISQLSDGRLLVIDIEGNIFVVNNLYNPHTMTMTFIATINYSSMLSRFNFAVQLPNNKVIMRTTDGLSLLY